jgi:YesN/AraC family two-component response regulator
MTAQILIVDDHEVLREGLKSLLAKSRPDWLICGEATDGEQAIQLAQELKPDVIILDITMPRMSGLEAASRPAPSKLKLAPCHYLSAAVFLSMNQSPVVLGEFW